MHNGSESADTASIAGGNAFATAKAQARPAIIARPNGRVSAPRDNPNVADIDPSRCVASAYPLP
jgi:hypothetical protein